MLVDSLSPGQGDAQTAQRGLDVLESYWQQVWPLSPCAVCSVAKVSAFDSQRRRAQQTGAEPSPAAAADLAQRANMSVEQVQRWFGRRTTAKRVTPPLPTVAAAPAAPPPEILEPERKMPPDRAARQLWETNARVRLLGGALARLGGPDPSALPYGRVSRSTSRSCAP